MKNGKLTNSKIAGYIVANIALYNSQTDMGYNSNYMSLKELETSLLEELEDNKEEILSTRYPEDLIYEYVDGFIPVYHSVLLELANEDNFLATEEPDIYAFDGKHTPVNAIAGNVYQHLSEIAYKWLEEAQENK